MCSYSLMANYNLKFVANLSPVCLSLVTNQRNIRLYTLNCRLYVNCGYGAQN